MAEELKELEELKNFEEAPPLWGWYLNIFPTQHIQVLGWVFSHRKGARLSDIRVSLAMELLESGGSIGVEIVFFGDDRCPPGDYLSSQHRNFSYGDQASEGRLAARRDSLREAATQISAVASHPAPAGIDRPFSAAISAGAADPSSRQEGYFLCLTF